VADSARTRHAGRLFAGIADRYDLLAEVLSFGQNGRWRRFMVSRVPARPGERVLDVATGTAGVARALARATGCRVVGIDPSPEMLAGGAAALRASPAGGRVRLVRGRAERLPFADGAFDHLTFTYLLRYVDDPGGTLAELARVVRPGGTMAALEFAVPANPGARAAWEAYTRFGLPVAGRLASRAWGEAGSFLGWSIRRFYEDHPMEAQEALWREAGIGRVRRRTMSLGGGVVWWGIRGG